MKHNITSTTPLKRTDFVLVSIASKSDMMFVPSSALTGTNVGSL